MSFKPTLYVKHQCESVNASPKKQNPVRNNKNVLQSTKLKDLKICKQNFLHIPAMKTFKKITMSRRQSNVTQLKFHLQTRKYMLANKVDLNDECLSTEKSKNLKTFQCTVCDFSTKQNCVLSKHVKEFHYREKPFKCEICLNCFGSKDTLTKHQRMVHENESFGVKGYLKTHQRTVHVNEKPNKREICQKSFGINWDLNKHQRTIHKMIDHL